MAFAESCSKFKSVVEFRLQEKMRQRRLFLLLAVLLGFAHGLVRRSSPRPMGGQMPSPLAGQTFPKGNNYQSPINTSPVLTGRPTPYGSFGMPAVAGAPTQNMQLPPGSLYGQPVPPAWSYGQMYLPRK